LSCCCFRVGDVTRVGRIVEVEEEEGNWNVEDDFGERVRDNMTAVEWSG
jgi:hypothetical protein